MHPRMHTSYFKYLFSGKRARAGYRPAGKAKKKSQPKQHRTMYNHFNTVFQRVKKALVDSPSAKFLKVGMSKKYLGDCSVAIIFLGKNPYASEEAQIVMQGKLPATGDKIHVDRDKKCAIFHFHDFIAKFDNLPTNEAVVEAALSYVVEKEQLASLNSGYEVLSEEQLQELRNEDERKEKENASKIGETKAKSCTRVPKNNGCHAEACTNIGSFDYEGKEGFYCDEHKLEGMVQVTLAKHSRQKRLPPPLFRLSESQVNFVATALVDFDSKHEKISLRSSDGHRKPSCDMGKACFYRISRKIPAETRDTGCVRCNTCNVNLHHDCFPLWHSAIFGEPFKFVFPTPLSLVPPAAPIDP